MPTPDFSSIGQNKTYQSSQEAVDAAAGKYHDNTAGLTEEQRLPLLPQGTAPAPFKNLHNVGQ